MFIRKQGKRWQLLHSCRDGSGRIYHRRLGHFTESGELGRKLDEISQKCPEVRFDRTRLMSKVVGFETSRETVREDIREDSGLDASRRSDKIRRYARALLRLLAEEDDGAVLQDAQEDLVLLSARLREFGEIDEIKVHLSRLSPRRRKFDRSEPKACLYLEALDQLSRKLQLQGQVEKALDVLGRRVECCATPEAQMRYGAMLQSTGHFDQAVLQYARVPSREPGKHYNLASIAWQKERKEEAVVHLLRGLTHDPEANLHFDESFGIRVMTGQPIKEDKERPVGPNPEYWHQFGHLWTTEGREFVHQICSQPLVRFWLRKSRRLGIKFRSLVPPASRRILLARALKQSDHQSLPSGKTVAGV